MQRALNPKGRLQELLQERYRRAPEYQTVSTQGPDHARTFVVEATLDERVLGRGVGPSKRGGSRRRRRTCHLWRRTRTACFHHLPSSWTERAATWFSVGCCPRRISAVRGNREYMPALARERNVAGHYDQLSVFAGNSNPELAQDICAYIGIPLGRAEVFKFSNDNTFVRINESVRENDVFVAVVLAPINDSIMEMLIMIDTIKRASAGRVTAVIPYFGYGRTDKKDQPRVPITARLVAKLVGVSGADRALLPISMPVRSRVS